MAPNNNSDLAARSANGAVTPATEDEDPDVGRATYASPPCFMHEVDSIYRGYLNRDEILALLNELLEGERAGAKLAGVLGKCATEIEIQTLLHNIGGDEARFCAMLSRQIERIGGAPSRATGKFYEKVLILDTLGKQLTLFNAGQGWVVRKLQEALPRIEDESLRADLLDMLKVHERNSTILAPAV